MMDYRSRRKNIKRNFGQARSVASKQATEETCLPAMPSIIVLSLCDADGPGQWYAGTVDGIKQARGFDFERVRLPVAPDDRHRTVPHAAASYCETVSVSTAGKQEVDTQSGDEHQQKDIGRNLPPKLAQDG